MTTDTTIWYLIGTLAVGGTERTLVDLVDGLDRDRFTPVIWTLTEPGPLAEDVPEDVPVRSLNAKHKLDLRAVVRFMLEVRREQPDILQSFLFFDNILARLSGVAGRETVVITGIREVPRNHARHRRFTDRLTQRFSDVIVSNSRAGARYITERGVPERKVHVVPNGRPIDDFAAAIPSAGLRESIGVPEDATVVGTVGRLVRRKGHYDLIEAWQSVTPDHPGVHLVIVGDGPEREGLVATAQEYDVADSVHLLGQRDDVPELLAEFDLFVFPSHSEGLPGALLEAMAAGLAVITTPVDGNAELVSDGEHGVHVPVADPTALAAAIDDLLRDRERAEKLGARAQERARTKFSVEAMVAAFEELYWTVSNH